MSYNRDYVNVRNKLERRDVDERTKTKFYDYVGFNFSCIQYDDHDYALFIFIH